MRATPTATPTTIPATVPLASLCGEGAGGIPVICGAGLLLVKVLGLVVGLVVGLVLAGLEVEIGELSLELELGLEITEGVDEAVALSPGELKAEDVEELVEPVTHIRCCEVASRNIAILLPVTE